MELRTFQSQSLGAEAEAEHHTSALSFNGPAAPCRDNRRAAVRGRKCDDASGRATRADHAQTQTPTDSPIPIKSNRGGDERSVRYPCPLS